MINYSQKINKISDRELCNDLQIYSGKVNKFWETKLSNLILELSNCRRHFKKNGATWNVLVKSTKLMLFIVPNRRTELKNRAKLLKTGDEIKILLLRELRSKSMCVCEFEYN